MTSLRKIIPRLTEAASVEDARSKLESAIDALENSAKEFGQAHAEWLQAGGGEEGQAGKNILSRRREIAIAAVTRGLAGGSH